MDGIFIMLILTPSPQKNGEFTGLESLIADCLYLKYDVILVLDLWRLVADNEFGYRLSDLLWAISRHLVTLDSFVDTLKGDTFMLDRYIWLDLQKVLQAHG
jgi:hypothetical protein